MNFLQTYRRHLIFKLAGIAAVILAVLSSAYLFMSADYARSVRKNTLALNERLTAQTATRIEASWDSLYNITTAFCYSPTVQQYFSVNSLNRLPDTQELASVFSNTILLNDRILSVYLYNADAKQIASMGKNFSIDTSVLNTDAVMDIRASHLKSNEKRPYYELIFPVYDLNNIQYQKLLGTCVFVLEPESFDDTLQNVQSTEDAVVFLLDSSDCILASAGSVESCGSTLASEILHSTSEKYFFTQTLSCNDWKIAGFLPESDLRKPDQNLKETQILVYCISLCLLLFLLLYCNYSIIKPITGISAFIRKINQNPDSRLSLDRPDEIGTVAKSLNQMLDKKQKMKQNQRRRAMRRLFLYNEWRGLNCYIFIIRYQIKIGKEIKIGYNKYKKVYCQENESAWHQNRYILITVSPRINFKVVHYEYINGYLELHLEDDYYGNTFNQRLYKYLRDNIDTESGDYLWHNWNGMKQGRLRYEYKIGDLLELADYLTKFISKIDPLIEDFLNTYYDGNNDTQKEIFTVSSIDFNKIEDGASVNINITDGTGSKVVLHTMSLKDVLSLKLKIPDYQRIYCWPQKNVEQLLDDIFIPRNHKYHLGTLILQKKGDDYDIIDGQQRTVTLALILRAMCIDNILLLKEKFDSVEAQKYIGYNRYIIEMYLDRHYPNIETRSKEAKKILDIISFDVLVLNDSSLELAYTFFSTQNARGKALTDYELLKSHHLRFIPESHEAQQRHLAKMWE